MTNNQFKDAMLAAGYKRSTPQAELGVADRQIIPMFQTCRPVLSAGGKAMIVGCSFASDDGNGFCIPMSRCAGCHPEKQPELWHS